MHIFSKGRFLFSSIVMLQIIKTITKGIYSIVVKICDEIEFTLKGEVSSTFNRTAAQSFHNHSLRSTRLQASDSVNGILNPENIEFVTSNSSTKKSAVVVTNVSHVSHTPTSSIQRKSVSAKGKSRPVSKTLDNSYPFQIPVSSLLDNIPMTLQRKSTRNKNHSQYTRSSQNAIQTSSPKIVNIASESPASKTNNIDENCILKLKNCNKGKNSISERGPSNVTKPNLTPINTKSSLLAVTPSHRSLDNKICNIVQSNKKQVFKDKDCHSDLHKIKQNSTKGNRNLRSEMKNDDNIKIKSKSSEKDITSAIFKDTQVRLDAKKENNIEGCTSNFTETADITKQDALCTKTPNKDDFIKEDICKDGESGFCKIWDFELKKNNMNFERKKTNTSPFSQKSCLNTRIKPSSTKKDLTSPDLKYSEDRLASKHANNIEERTINFSPSIAECTRKDDAQYSTNSIKDDATKYEVRNFRESEIAGEEKGIKNLNREKTNSSVFSANDITATPSEDEKEALGSFGTATQVYLDYLKEIIPAIYEIESKILTLCKVHYKKSDISIGEFCEIDAEYEKLIERSREVNGPTYNHLIIVYACEIQNIVRILHQDIKLSLNSANRMKLSFCMEQLARSLGTSRNVLFDVNKESAKLGTQMAKPATALKRLKCNRRK